MKKILNKQINTGITLIALVITIVVLIILATVVINLSLSDNGIFNRAREAKEQYQNASQYEEEQIAKFTNGINGYIDGNRNSITLTAEQWQSIQNEISTLKSNATTIQSKVTALESKQALNYSYNEQDTGLKWIDGKTIYQKSVNFGALPNATKKSVAHDISNLGDVIDVKCIGNKSDSHISIPYTHHNNLVGQLKLDVTNTNIIIETQYNFSTYSAIVTLQYTKSN